MIIQLKNYPIVSNGVEKLAETQEELQFVIKIIRWVLLNESDWTQMPDNPISDENRALWAEFRQMLRDLPSNVPQPTSATIEIPDPPEWGRPASWVNLTPDADWNIYD